MNVKCFHSFEHIFNILQKILRILLFFLWLCDLGFFIFLLSWQDNIHLSHQKCKIFFCCDFSFLSFLHLQWLLFVCFSWCASLEVFSVEPYNHTYPSHTQFPFSKWYGFGFIDFVLYIVIVGRTPWYHFVQHVTGIPKKKILFPQDCINIKQTRKYSPLRGLTSAKAFLAFGRSLFGLRPRP